MDRFRQELGRSRAAKIGDGVEIIINLGSQPVCMLRVVSTIIIILFYIQLAAQQPVFTHSSWIRVEDGLPQSFISGLQQDRDGFLWIGTRDGLARYDGREFRVFRPRNKDSTALSSNVIIDLFLDSQNLLWIFYINEKIDCFDPAKMQVCYRDSFEVVRQLLAELKVKNFIRDRAGRFWIRSNYDGVACYDPSKNKTKWFNSKNKTLRTDHLLGITEDPAGKIYVITDEGIERIDTNNTEAPFFIPFDPSIKVDFNRDVNHIVQSLSDGQIALTDKNRLIIFNPLVKKFFIYELPPQVPASENIIQQLQVGKDGMLYVAAGGGVFRFEKNGRFTWLWQANNSNPFANDCRSFLVDRSSVIWFGTNAAGIHKIDMHALPFASKLYTINFTTDVLSGYSGPDKIPSLLKEGKWAYTMRSCYDRDNVLWITYQPVENQEFPISVYTWNGTVFTKAASPGGLYPVIKGLSLSPSGNMHAIDLKGNTWIWKKSNLLPEFFPSVLSINAVSSVVDMETDGNEYWVSTDKDGLFYVQHNKAVQHFSNSTRPEWPVAPLTDLCRDPVNPRILWIGTLGNGMIRFNKSSHAIKIFTTENDLPNNTVYSIVPDKQGNLWITTNKGITRFTPSTESFSNYDIKDGIIGNEFNRFHHLRLPTGEIAFGGPDGYTLFDPSKFLTDSFATPVGLTSLLINNKPVDFDGTGKSLPEPLNQLTKLVLPYNKNFLQFEFAGLQFNQPEKIKYRYMLEGYDKDWIVSNDHNRAAYTRLPPGHYSFLVNASNTSGVWSPIIKKLAVHIKPPVWATWWAYLVYVLIAFALVRFYWKFRTNKIRLQHEIALEQSKAKQLKEVDDMKDRFFSNITHELRTPLTLILTPLEKLKDQPLYSPADKRILSGAYNNAEHLLRLINQLLDISKIESGQMNVHPTVGELSSFVENCIQQFLAQAKLANINLQFINKNISGLYLFDQDKWEKIIFNLLGNAIKFTPEGGDITVLVSSTANEHKTLVHFSVNDTGPGITETDIPKLFDRFFMADHSNLKQTGGTGIGLSLVKELAELMHGTVEVQSQPGKGSCFTVSVPTTKLSSAAPPSLDNKNENKVAVLSTGSKNEKPIVLLVEDNEELLAFLSGSLSDGWQVMEANNGKQGWEMVLNELPDFIISDLMMPGMNGYELCSKVKADPRTGHIGFILLSARAAHESKLTGLKTGADEYLTKPFHLDELEIKLRNLLEQQKRLRQFLQKELLPDTPLRKLPHVNDVFIQELYGRLDEKMDDPAMSVDTLARSVNMSQRTLNRKLKAILNLTPVEFIRQYRLQKAALLLSSGLAITDTAYSVGFETASYFTQCFKEHFGKTPTEFTSQKTA